MPRGIDLVILYRMLVCVRDSGSMNVTQLVRCVGGSASTITRYVDLAVSWGLLEEETGRERRLRLTRKGEDFLFLFSRLLALVPELEKR
ncbi:hypothetical protein J4526_01755 [Desulfurococcaceae archaeon MEX13E-LK6-19]|nr:hypothetical protein J4526_01755 [Desulfurococcaceae archaeon MEX13E-LK6-19]